MAALPKLAVQPTIGVDFQTDVRPAWAGHIECVLTVSLHGRLNGKTMFMIEVAQAGIFSVPRLALQEMARFAKESAAEVLFPYARKHLTAMAVNAGFQPMILDHVDFASLLQRTKKQARPELRLATDNRPALPANATAKPAATDPQISTPPTAVVGPRTASPLTLLSIAFFFVAAGAIWLWPTKPAPNTAPPTAVSQGSINTAAAREQQKLRKRAESIERILAASHARLAEQPEGAYTLELGTLASADAIPSLEVLPIQRALFVEPRADGSVAVLYGVFPDASLANAAESELGSRLPAELKPSKRVLRIDERAPPISDPAPAPTR